MTNHKCKVPFSQVEIHEDGNIYVCCPIKTKLSIGNIYKESFDKIWHSKKAKKLRQEILRGNYCFCDLKICDPKDNIEQDKLDLIENFETEFEEKPSYPQYVKFCHDYHCNLKCATCRDKFHTNSKEKTKELNSKIEKIYLPILKNCKVVSLNGSGEALSSKHCRTLIKAIAKKYPNIKFDLHTNGLLCNKKNLEELGIIDKIASIGISMHAKTKEIYDKIMLHGDFEKVLKNLNWLSSLKKEGKIKKLDLYFVVQKTNYKEMGAFLEFAKKLDADVYFWEYRNWGNIWGRKNYDKVAVFEKHHLEYNKFAKYLAKDIFKSKNCHFNNFLKQIKPIKFYEHIFYIIKHKIKK